MKAIILAAGAGKRMKSDFPKVLHTIVGKPMLHCVIDTCIAAGIDDITVVIGKNGDEIIKATDRPVNFVWQNEQLGTGHAVMCAKDSIDPDDKVVVLNGDAPLVTSGFLRGLMEFQLEKDAHGVVVATNVPDPTGYGRVMTNEHGDFSAIVEQRDLHLDGGSDNNCIYTGILMANGRELLYALEHVDNKNNQSEYYITDVPLIMKEDGFNVEIYNDPDYLQFLGVNSQRQLAEAGLVFRDRILDAHFENGVVIVDPSSVYIDMDVEISPRVIIHPGTSIFGNTRIKEGAQIGPYTQITNSVIGSGTVVRNSVLETVHVGSNCQIGPFAYLRPGTVIGNRCRVGNFVEVKNAKLGDDTTAAHLAYIGDAQIGKGVNFGCGAITVNYDGESKHVTVVEDNAFIGSNANLIAPVTVHSGAFIAAGSTIDKEVPAGTLAIARERQTNKEGFASKYKARSDE